MATRRKIKNDIQDNNIQKNEQGEVLTIDTIGEKLPELNIKLLTKDEIENSGNGLPYLLKGKVKEHITILADSISAIINLPSGLNDEQFKTLVTIEINNMKKDIQELVDGMNKLYEMIKGE